MSESTRTRELCRYIEINRQAMVLPIIGGPWMPVGWPDRLFVLPGLHIWVEFKIGSGTLKPRQKERCFELLEHGAFVFCAVLDEFHFNIEVQSIDGEWVWQTRWSKFIQHLKEICERDVTKVACGRYSHS